MSSCSIIPLSAVMGTSCNRMCFEKCGGGVEAWGKLVNLMWASCLYTCLKKPTILALTASFYANLPNLGGR